MKKLINSIKNKANSAIISARTAIESTSGEGYIDPSDDASKSSIGKPSTTYNGEFD